MGAIHFSLDEKLLEFFSRQLPLARFVETGTFQGDSLRRARRFFQECHSVEMSPHYFTAAQKMFADDPGVHLALGDSPGFLRCWQEKFRGEPALFWLDAHWCVADKTAGQNSQSPLLGEIEALSELPSGSVVLIDDARLYLSAPPAPHEFQDWPDFHSVVSALFKISLRHRLLILNDVIVFYPEGLQSALTDFAHRNGTDWLLLANQSRSYQEWEAEKFALQKQLSDYRQCFSNPFKFVRQVWRECFGGRK